MRVDQTVPQRRMGLGLAPVEEQRGRGKVKVKQHDETLGSDSRKVLETVKWIVEPGCYGLDDCEAMVRLTWMVMLA